MDDIGASSKIKDIVSLSTQMNDIRDVDVLLEEILTQAREVLQANAGSIYITEGKNLAINYAQNDTMQAELPVGEKLIYSYFKIPINTASISGYCVSTRQVLSIKDVYYIPTNAPYKFSKKYDKESGYRTKSVIAAPLISTSNEVLGVIQLINKLDKKKKIIEFEKEDLLLIKHYASYASSALQRAKMTRTLLLRMMKMAELRDPKETYHHVNRVGSFSTELFETWAVLHKMHQKSIQKSKDTLRMAAMLHDVGKVAISDVILKKPGRFNDQEREIIKTHTFLGARLFQDSHSDLDEASRIVSLTHHENWDGSGYPGHIDPHTEEVLVFDEDGGPAGKREYEIPLFGRIVGICDVYDALRSHRVYKSNWTMEQTTKEMRNLSGTKFDPELIDVFFKVLPRIQELEKKYSEGHKE